MKLNLDRLSRKQLVQLRHIVETSNGVRLPEVPRDRRSNRQLRANDLALLLDRIEAEIEQHHERTGTWRRPDPDQLSQIRNAFVLLDPIALPADIFAAEIDARANLIAAERAQRDFEQRLAEAPVVPSDHAKIVRLRHC